MGNELETQLMVEILELKEQLENKSQYPANVIYAIECKLQNKLDELELLHCLEEIK